MDKTQTYIHERLPMEYQEVYRRFCIGEEKPTLGEDVELWGYVNKISNKLKEMRPSAVKKRIERLDDKIDDIQDDIDYLERQVRDQEEQKRELEDEVKKLRNILDIIEQ